jgi:succinate dehydrogenase flavin-adding protein (antitoxin of CptAB toxin-antitoxin module)
LERLRGLFNTKLHYAEYDNDPLMAPKFIMGTPALRRYIVDSACDNVTYECIENAIQKLEKKARQLEIDIGIASETQTATHLFRTVQSTIGMASYMSSCCCEMHTHIRRLFCEKVAKFILSKPEPESMKMPENSWGWVKIAEGDIPTKNDNIYRAKVLECLSHLQLLSWDIAVSMFEILREGQEMVNLLAKCHPETAKWICNILDEFAKTETRKVSDEVRDVLDTQKLLLDVSEGDLADWFEMPEHLKGLAAKNPLVKKILASLISMFRMIETCLLHIYAKKVVSAFIKTLEQKVLDAPTQAFATFTTEELQRLRSEVMSMRERIQLLQVTQQGLTPTKRAKVQTQTSIFGAFTGVVKKALFID